MRAWSVLIVLAFLVLGLSACGDRETPPATQPATTSSAARPGTLVCTVTCDVTRKDRQKPDVNAVVLLVPAGLSESVGPIATLNPASLPESFTRTGACLAKVGPDGLATLHPAPGAYRVLVFSDSNWANEKDFDANRKALQGLIDDYASMSRQALYEDRVEIRPGQTAKLAHNFAL